MDYDLGTIKVTASDMMSDDACCTKWRGMPSYCFAAACTKVALTKGIESYTHYSGVIADAWLYMREGKALNDGTVWNKMEDLFELTIDYFYHNIS